MSERPILAETTTPAGTPVVLFEDTWQLHVLNPDGGHIELEPHLNDVLDAVESSDHREPDGWPHRERFFKRDVGPSRWLLVVVDYEQEQHESLPHSVIDMAARRTDGHHEHKDRRSHL